MAMRVWEPVEISVNRIDFNDIITTSTGTSDTPLGGGEDIMGGSGSSDIASDIRD